jgi:dipeptidyl aminopeptidase/acylaminoacyl peptidase
MLFRTAAMQEDLFVMAADGSGLRRLTEDVAKDRNPLWSPDGQQVTFYSNRSGRYEVWTVDRDGSNLRQRTVSLGVITVQGSTASPVWSPVDRSMVANIAGQIARFDLQEEPVQPSEVEPLGMSCGEGRSTQPLSWSPDGRRISGICAGTNGQMLAGVLAYDLESGASRFVAIDLPIPTTRHAYPPLAWLPDSRRGVVRWGAHILLVDTTTGEVTTLVGGLHRDGGWVRVSADGRWLYMLDSRDEGDLWLASREPPAAPAAESPGASRPAP